MSTEDKPRKGYSTYLKMKVYSILSFLAIIIIYAVLLTGIQEVVSDEILEGSTRLRIVNNAGYPIELYWINIFDEPVQLVKQTTKPIRDKDETDIISYSTHQFSVLYFDTSRHGQVNFTKGDSDESAIISFDPDTNDLKVVIKTKVDEFIDKLKESLKVCENNSSVEYSSCAASIIGKDIDEITSKKETAESYLTTLSRTLRNYTCADETLKPSTSKSSYDMMYGDKTLKIEVLLDKPNAKIWYVDDFVSSEECDILMEHGRPILERAAVAGEYGEAIYSEHRKAQQAEFNYHEGGEDNPLWDLSQRIFGLTNEHLDMNLNEEGQEDLMIIQYGVGDEYTPHCDGPCDGSKHIQGGRVATALLYCKEPTKGGMTIFTKTGIVVKPKVGAATFFGFMGKNGIMDDGGYTEHTGCPIYEGEKWVVTLWMREGVSLEEPYSIFDTSGIKMLDEDLEGSSLSGIDETCSDTNSCEQTDEL